MDLFNCNYLFVSCYNIWKSSHSKKYSFMVTENPIGGNNKKSELNIKTNSSRV